MKDFYGFPTRRLSSAILELDCLSTAGPRIVRLSYKGSPNLFAEVPEIKVATPFGEYRYLGGHRLWHAPESMPGSYIPDGDGLTLTEIPTGLVLDGALERSTGLRKRLEIRLDPALPRLDLVHTIFNEGPQPADVAPWALTMFRLGGVAVLPLRNGAPKEPGLLPDRDLTLWPYSRIDDPRLHLNDDFILVDAQNLAQPFKIGALSPIGWIAYWLDGVLLRKSYEPQTEAPHPDLNCNSEIYSGPHFIEIESLGPLAALPAGGSVSHHETWDLFDSLDQPWLPAPVADRLRLHR